MFPYGYQRVHTPSHNKLMRVSKDIVDGIESVHRSKFVYGSIFEVIYPASGSSCDWAYDTANIPCSFAPELRDRGRYGFLLPEDQIQEMRKNISFYEVVFILFLNSRSTDLIRPYLIFYQTSIFIYSI